MGAWCAAALVHAALLAAAFATPLRNASAPRAAAEPAFTILLSRSSLPELFPQTEQPVEPPHDEPGLALVPEPEPSVEEPTEALLPAPQLAEVIEEPAPAPDAPVRPPAESEAAAAESSALAAANEPIEASAPVAPAAASEAIANDAPAIGVGGAQPVASATEHRSAPASPAAAPPAPVSGAGSEGIAGATGNATSASNGSGTLPVGPTRAARALANPKPAYPSTSIRLREEGEVLCRLTIDADGRVVDVVVARSSGHARLDAAAVRAVRQWRFEPALRNGVAEATTATLPVVFRLRDAG